MCKRDREIAIYEKIGNLLYSIGKYHLCMVSIEGMKGRGKISGKCKKVSKKGFVWLVVIAFAFLFSISCAFGAQFPLPIDSVSPAYVDIDNDYDLFVANSEGIVYFYENVGTANSPSWAEEVYLFDVGDYAYMQINKLI